MQSNTSAAIDPQHIAVIEPVRGSDIPVRLMYVELIDGVYAPITCACRLARARFQLVMFASGNGGRRHGDGARLFAERKAGPRSNFSKPATP